VVTDRRPPERPVSPYLRAATLILALLPVMIIRPAETPAEVRTTVRIDATNSLIFGAAEPLSAGLATAELDLEALGNRDVRSRFQLRSTLLENAPAATASNPTAATVITVPRAEIRWRMDAGASTVRFTVGRTRLTWGDGQLYNAGDVINGVRPSNTDLTATTLRDETQWLTVAYLPLGRFSFLEAVALFPMSRVGGVDETGGDDPDIATPTLAGSIAPSRAAETAGGGRIQGQIGGIKSEIGYLYRGSEETHQPYASLQGNLFVDWYAALSWAGGAADAPGLAASGGLFHTLNGDRLGTFTARAETLWTEERETLRLFPELTWAPSQLLTLYLRGEVLLAEESAWRDAGDPDAVVAAGSRWTPLTGLTLSLSGVGESRRDLVALVAAVSYTF
jgi:hypothetical protein